MGILLSMLLALSLVGEGAVRLYDFLAHGIGPWVSARSYIDPEIGWPGWKFSDPTWKRPRIFVIGDFTAPLPGLAPEQLYYRVLGDRLGVGVFAYGGPGFGTLQELLILDRYLPEAKPDLIVLQVSGNDFINNSWALERASRLNNNLLVRPFLEDGRITYRFPGSSARQFFAMHSRLVYASALGLDRIGAVLAARGVVHTVEADMATRGRDLPAFREALVTTETLIRRVKDRLGAVPLVVFQADSWFMDHWREVLDRAHVPHIDGVPERIRAAEVAGRRVYSSDGAHWNAEGHAVCGATLAEWISRRGYLKEP